MNMIINTHIGLLLASGIGVAVADVLAVTLLGGAVLLVGPWIMIILGTFWYNLVVFDTMWVLFGDF